jgi:NDP-sugar pyrophosphorylase family protein
MGWLGGAAPATAFGQRSEIDATAHLTRSIVWDDVQVGPGCQLDACILTDGVRIPGGATYRGVILMPGDHGPVATAWTDSLESLA